VVLAEDWHKAGLAAYPKTLYFVAVNEQDSIGGYISWSFIGGWQSGVIELEQIGVEPDSRGQGVGKILITQSLGEVRKFLRATAGRDVRIIKVDTAATNQAQELYRKTLGAEIEFTIKNYLHNEDEVIMLKRFD
jgi:ribosomal protein S18 acetylase RimI-like enzyme